MSDHPANREPELLTITEAAELLRAPVATLRYWRHLGTGPRSFRLGRRVLYRYDDLQEWVEQQMRSSATGCGPARGVPDLLLGILSSSGCFGMLREEPFRVRSGSPVCQPGRTEVPKEKRMASVEKRVRDGRTTYQARWRDEQDRQRKKSFTKKADADRYAATVEADKARGTYIEPSKITVAEYAQEWAAARPHRPTTARRTEMMIRLHIEATRLGGRKLAEVRPSEVQAWATDRSRVLAPTTVRQALGLLRSVYGAAVLDRLVAVSPVVRVQLPRHERERIVPLSVDQVAALADAMPKRYRAMVLTQAGLGLRIGELLALRVQDIDFLRRTVRIQWQFTQGSKGERSEPKTPRSRRVIPLPRVVADALAAHLAAHPAAADGTIFTTQKQAPLGHVYYGHNLMSRAVAAAGLPPGTRSHDLRHHYASVLLAAGESVVAVAERLGHEDASLVLTTYGHLMPDSDDRTRSAIDAAWATVGESCAPDVPRADDRSVSRPVPR